MFKTLEFWALSISILAMGISSYTWYRSYKIEQDRRDDEKKDQNSAVLRGNLILQMDQLFIENTGHSEARNVQIFLDEIPVLEHLGIIDGKLNYTIGALSTLKLQTAFGSDNMPSKSIEIIWDDDYSKGKFYRNSLGY